jgi:hypothetical protein
MSLRKVLLTWDTTALVAATPKTVAEFPAPAGADLEMAELVVGCDASTAGSLKIEFGTFTTTGTGTAVAAANLMIVSSTDRGVTSSVTAAKISDTVEPAGFTTVIGGNAKWPIVLVPLPCYFPLQLPLLEGFTVPHSTLMALRLTASIGCNTAGWVAWKELRSGGSP